jgi:hypothetical protein
LSPATCRVVAFPLGSRARCPYADERRCNV